MKKYRITVVSLLALLIAAPCFLFAWQLFAERLDAIEATVAADATVVSTGTSLGGSGARRYPVPWAEIRFSLADGRTITTTLRPPPFSVASGETAVRIRYKPNDPRYVVAESDSKSFLAILTTLSFGVIFLVVSYFASLRDGPVQRGWQHQRAAQREQQGGT